MQDLDENTVTEAALAQMANTPDPRLKEIMDAAVRHLHAFARPRVFRSGSPKCRSASFPEPAAPSDFPD